MKILSRKLLLAASVATLGLGAYGAHASPTATMTANFGSVGALTATQVAPMYFGTWQLTGVDAVNTVVLTMTTAGVVTADTSAGTAGAVRVRNGTPGQQTVQIDDGSHSEDMLVIHMQHSAITDNTTGAALDDITYRTATQGANQPIAAALTNVDVTIVDGTLAEPVYFGGTFTITDQIVGQASSTFDVTYSY